MSFFKPKLLPLLASFLGTYTFSAVYASIYSDADRGTYHAAKNSSLGFLWSSFDSLVKQNGAFFNNAFWCAYQTSGLLAFCKWHETGSKIALLWGAVTLVHQARWAYNGSAAQHIFTFKPDDNRQYPQGDAFQVPNYQAPTAPYPPYSPQSTAASAPPIDATTPAPNYAIYTDPNGVASYPTLSGATTGGDYDAFTRTSANSVGSGWSH